MVNSKSQSASEAYQALGLNLSVRGKMTDCGNGCDCDVYCDTDNWLLRL